MLGLHNLPGMRDVAGGRAVELVAATVGNQTSLDFPVPMRGYRDCRFSFAGVKATIYDYVNRFKKKTELDCDEHIPNLGLNTLPGFHYKISNVLFVQAKYVQHCSTV